MQKRTDFISNFVMIDNQPAWLNFDEGRVILHRGEVSFTETHLRDHLGNTRVVCGRINNALVVKQGNSYYPFGMNIKGLTTGIVFGSSSYSKNKYLYNGKLFQDELGLDWLDFHARFYDPAIVRTTTQDPMAESFYSESPYSFMGNNPIKHIDPNGMEYELTDYRNRKGELLYKTDDGLNDVIIVKDVSIPKLESELQTAKDNGTINDPITNQQKMHTLGITPQQYAEDAFKGTGSDEWTTGYKAAYKKEFEGESSFALKLSVFISAVFSGGEDGPMQLQGGVMAGSNEGKTDKNEDKINRLNPYSSFKNNTPLIDLNSNKNDRIDFPYQGVGLPPK